MNITQELCLITAQNRLNDSACELYIESESMSRHAEPGQFVMVGCGECHLLRRPISICQTTGKLLRLVYEVRGKGTEWLSHQKKGGTVDVLGTLGRGFHTVSSERVLFIGGGIGVPPLLMAAQRAAYADAALGFPDSRRSLLTEDFRRICHRVMIAYERGGGGRQGGTAGTAIDAARLLFKDAHYDVICACGPMGLLKAAAALADEKGIPCQVSMEERMGCGIGACLVCAVPLQKDGRIVYGHVCKDGPVFPAEEVFPHD